jgi:hypothetical protein
MVCATGPLLSFLHRLESPYVAVSPGVDVAVFARLSGGYTLVYYGGAGGRYEVGSIVELLLAIGEKRALEPYWQLCYPSCSSDSSVFKRLLLKEGS